MGKRIVKAFHVLLAVCMLFVLLAVPGVASGSVTDVSLNTDSIGRMSGSKQTGTPLVATVTVDGKKVKGNTLVNWKSSNTSVATVSKKGVVKAKKISTSMRMAVITATAKDGSGKSASCVVYVYNPDKVLESPLYSSGATGSTKLPDFGEDYVPQGVCVVGDYLFVTAYDSTDSTKNGVCYILKNGKLQKTIQLVPGHVGAISYDKKNKRVVVCATYTKNSKTVYRVAHCSYSEFLNTKAGKQPAFRYNTVKNTTSFLTCYNGNLWIGVFDEDAKSEPLYCYKYSKSKGYTLKKTYTLGVKKAQGIAFINDKTVLVSSSYGRQNPSYIYKCKLDGTTFVAKKRARLPNMSEDIHLEGKTLYVIFESGAAPYQTKWYPVLRPVDRVVEYDRTALEFEDYIDLI